MALAASCEAPQANRNDFCFLCNAGRLEANSINHSCDYVQLIAMALWNGAVLCVKSVQVFAGCSTAVRCTVAVSVALWLSDISLAMTVNSLVETGQIFVY